MEQPYTQEHLVQFIYGETPVLESFEIEDAIENNAGLSQQYTALKSSVALLPNVSFEPSNDSILRLLAYNKNSLLNVSC